MAIRIDDLNEEEFYKSIEEIVVPDLQKTDPHPSDLHRKIAEPDALHHDSVEYSHATEPLRNVRHTVDAAGGSVHKRDFDKHGIKTNQVRHLLSGSGHLTSAALTGAINSAPKGKFNISHAKYAPEHQGQRHSAEASNVVQFNLTDNHLKQLHENGSYPTYRWLNMSSQNSGHPATDHTVGWARYTGNSDGVHIDEIQSDFNHHTDRQISEEMGGHPQLKEQVPMRLQHMHDIRSTVFGGRDSHQVLHEALHQWLRDKGHDGLKIHMNSPELKSKINGFDANREPPVHIKDTYGKGPSKLGYGQGTYGEIPTHTNTEHVGMPTKATILKKAVRLRDLLTQVSNNRNVLAPNDYVDQKAAEEEQIREKAEQAMEHMEHDEGVYSHQVKKGLSIFKAVLDKKMKKGAGGTTPAGASAPVAQAPPPPAPGVGKPVGNISAGLSTPGTSMEGGSGGVSASDAIANSKAGSPRAVSTGVGG